MLGKLTNNLPGFGYAQKRHQLTMWQKYASNCIATLTYSPDNNLFYVRIPQNQKVSLPSNPQYLKVKHKNREVIFNIRDQVLKTVKQKKKKQLDVNVDVNVQVNDLVIGEEEGENVEIVRQILVPLDLSPLEIQRLTFLINSYNLSGVSDIPLEYLIVFPGVIRPLSESDPFIIEGADFFFI